MKTKFLIVSLLGIVAFVLITSFSKNEDAKTKYAKLNFGIYTYVEFDNGETEYLSKKIDIHGGKFNADDLFLEKVKAFKYLNTLGYKIQSGGINDIEFLFIKQQ